MEINKRIFLISILTLLVSTTATNIQNSNVNTTLKQTNAVVAPQNTLYPINDMYGVKKKVVNTQNQYLKARETQAKQAEDYEKMYK